MKSFTISSLFAVFFLLVTTTVSLAQTYNDGPMELQIRVTQIRVDYHPDDNKSNDFNLSGSIGAILGSVISVPSLETDEITCKVWSRDNSSGWIGGDCLPGDLPLTSGGPESYTVTPPAMTYTYTGQTVPQFFDLKLEAWEDEKPGDFDALPSVPFVAQNNCKSNNFSRCDFDGASTNCYTLFGAGVLSMQDDIHCDANPFATGIDYRAAGPPCQWNDHGFIAGSCPNNNYYQPRIQSFYRFTSGDACGSPLDLGVLSAGVSLSHSNSNECYTNTFASSPGNDVFYKFTINAPIGVTISLCNGTTTFDTYLYLLDNNCAINASNDDGPGCNTQSQISQSLCRTGDYYVVVDGKTANDMGTFEITIDENPNFSFKADITKTDPECAGEANGSAIVDITGGVFPFDFVWSDGFTDSINTGLNAGTYSVTVTDDNNCSVADTITLIDPAAMTLSTSIDQPLTCSGLDDAKISATASGGTSPYFYSWNTNPPQTSQQAVNLSSGIYDVTVTDLRGCGITSDTTGNTVVVAPSSPIVITNSFSNIQCFGDNDGWISLNVSGGNPPYDYVWSNSSTTDSVFGLAPGPITVTVYDATGNGRLCFETETFFITEPPLLTSVVNAERQVSCNGGSDGAVDLGVNGGTPPYRYNWASGSMGEDLLNASAGAYSVTVLDDNDCIDTSNGSLSEPAELIISAVPTASGCEGSNSGSIDVTVNGGTPPYEYNWSNLDTTEDLSGLEGGNYLVVVTDDNNCTEIASATVNENAGFVVQISVTKPSCVGETNGEIELTTVGGITPITYNWAGEPSITTGQRTDLAAGLYAVTVTDDNGCSDTLNIAVDDPNITNCTTAELDGVVVPNAFSPNGDDINEHFDYHSSVDLVNVEVKVFDRWGAKVYENLSQSEGLGQGWDGVINGTNAQVAAYIYLMTITYADPMLPEEQRTGTITLIR